MSVSNIHTSFKPFHAKQGGWLSIEMIGIIIAATMLGISFSKYYVSYQTNNTALVVADQLSRITKATESYTKANWQALMNEAAGGAATIEFQDLSLTNPYRALSQ